MRPVSHRTKRMKQPRTIIPGRRRFCEMRTIMEKRKRRARAEMVTSKGKILDGWRKGERG